MVFVLNRLDEIPAFVSHYGYVSAGELQHQLATPDNKQRDDLFKLLHLEQTDLTIPNKDVAHSAPEFNEPELVRLRNAMVSYSGKVIFSHLIGQSKHDSIGSSVVKMVLAKPAYLI